MPTNYADRLIDAIEETKNPSVMGLDPRPDKIPGHIARRAMRVYGDTKEAVRDAYVDFFTLIIDTTADDIPAVKPQAAFYEFGPEGMTALDHIVRYARTLGMIVILDAKKGDIGPTADAYAQAYLGGIELLSGRKIDGWDFDAITVAPYLGSDGVKWWVANGVFIYLLLWLVGVIYLFNI